VDEHNWLALTFLNESDLYARMGKLWHAATIRSRCREAKVRQNAGERW
jgi:hypothetical protein